MRSRWSCERWRSELGDMSAVQCFCPRLNIGATDCHRARSALVVAQDSQGERPGAERAFAKFINEAHKETQTFARLTKADYQAFRALKNHLVNRKTAALRPAFAVNDNVSIHTSTFPVPSSGAEGQRGCEDIKTPKHGGNVAASALDEKKLVPSTRITS